MVLTWPYFPVSPFSIPFSVLLPEWFQKNANPFLPFLCFQNSLRISSPLVKSIPLPKPEDSSWSALVSFHPHLTHLCDRCCALGINMGFSVASMTYSSLIETLLLSQSYPFPKDSSQVPFNTFYSDITPFRIHLWPLKLPSHFQLFIEVGSISRGQ